MKSHNRPILIAVILALILSPFAGVAVAYALCNAPGPFVQIKPGIGLNVRSTPINGPVSTVVTNDSGPLAVTQIDSESCWLFIRQPQGYISNSTQYWQAVTATSPQATVTRIATQPSPQATATAKPPTPSPLPSPTQIITNSPIPPARQTENATQLGIKLCWILPGSPKDSPGDCSILPLGSKITQEIVQIQP